MNFSCIVARSRFRWSTVGAVPERPEISMRLYFLRAVVLNHRFNAGSFYRAGTHPGLHRQLLSKGNVMRQIKLFKSVIIVLAITFTIVLTGRLLPGPVPASAAKIYKYKVVSIGTANTVYEYEKQLNDMAFQGWTFDHTVPRREWAVFRK